MSDTEIYKQIREYKDQNAIDEILKQIEDGSIDVNHVLNLRHRSIENVSLFSLA